MVNGKELVPKLRFNGFSDEWEQCKLGDISKISTGYPFKSDEFDENGEYLVVTNGNIQEYLPFVDDSIGNRINIHDIELNKYILTSNDILVTMDGTVGRVAKVNYSKQILAQRVGRIKSDENTEFMYQSLINGKFFKEMTLLSHGGTIKHISLTEISNYKFLTPKSLEEQYKIGNLLHSLDYLITLHQSKLENLEETKKGLLQKMFPKNNEVIPNIRFNSFTDDWEQCKLGEFYFFKNGLNKEKEFFGKGTPIVNFVDVFHNRGMYSNNLKGLVELSEKEINNFSVEQGDIFFTRTSETIEEIGYPSVMLDSPINTVFSGFVLRGRAIGKDPLSLKFKRYVFFTESFRKEIQTKSSMTTRALTSGTALKEMYFKYPVNKYEQDKIGNLFQSLDHLITLHQSKLDNLEKTKKGLLQQIFPKINEVIPIIRFNNFNEKWNQCKLKLLLNKNIKKNKELTIDNVESVSNKAGFIKQTEHFEDYSVASVDLSNYYIIQEKQFAYNPSRINVGSIAYKAKGDVISVVSPLYVSFYTHDNLDDIFLWNWFKTMNFERQRQTLSEGGVRDTLSFNQLSEMNILLPSNYEQTNIGNLFSSLDHLITLHQSKLKALDVIKNSLLQKMFI